MKHLPTEDKAGIYLTVIAHLTVIIVALAAGLHVSLKHDNNFVIDYSDPQTLKQIEKLAEQKDQLEKEVSMKQQIAAKIEKELSSGEPVRSIAVNRGALKDDRGTDVKKLYEDAEKLQKELAKGFDLPDEDEVAESSGSREDDSKAKAYSGPSVLEYELGDRHASHLPIPAYRCMGAGTVKVLIDVNPKGDVINAKIDPSASSTDGCLRNFAIRASRASRFSASTSAPAKQRGYIIYQFIAQ